MAPTTRPEPSSAPERVRTRSWVPVLVAAATGIGATIAFDRPRELAASGSSCPDSDGDGLIDLQEDILGTYSDSADSDEDGYSDLEEIARASDPLDELSLPDDSHELSIGLTARVEEGVVTLVAPVYARSGSFGQIDLEFGVIFPDGSRYEIQPVLYLPVLKGGVYASQQQNFRVVLLEMPFPQSIVQGLGQLSLYGVVEDPAASSSGSAAALNLLDFSGVIVMAQNTTGQGGGGVIYGPIVPNSEIPASWATGEICWHQAAPVGMVGSSTAYEVTKGSCTPSDTYCSSTECTSRVGTNMLLVDPATLLGG